jgi:hypothetical protein
LHLAQCTAEAARQSIVLMVHDDTTLDFSVHRRFKGAGWDAVVRAAQDRRPAAGGNSLTALRPARAMGAATAPTRQGEIVVCIALAGPGASAAASTDGLTPNRYFLRGVICLANDPEGPFRPHDPRRGLPARPGCASPK